MQSVGMPQIAHHRVTTEPAAALVVIIHTRGKQTGVGICLTSFTAAVLLELKHGSKQRGLTGKGYLSMKRNRILIYATICTGPRKVALSTARQISG